MIRKSLLTSLVLSLLSIGARAEGIIGHLKSKGADCGIVDVKDAYLEEAGGNKRLVLKTTIANLAYDKQITVHTHGSNRSSLAQWSNSWWQYSVSAAWTGQSQNVDQVTVTDQRVGPGDEYEVSLEVVMSGATYSCSHIQIGK